MQSKLSLPLTFWGLERWPFRGGLAVRQFYPTVGHNEALARIEYLVESRRRLGLLLGDAGVGKSLVLRVAADQLTRKGAAAVAVDAFGATTRELLWNIACGLQTVPREDADVAWLWRQIADRVAENRMQQRATVVLVDDVGQAGPDLMTQLVRLARLDTTAEARWTLVVAAEQTQAARWHNSLLAAVDLRIELSPWTADDTIGYIQTALVDAGRMEPVFDDRALDKLHELAGGVPRQVARLADYALLAGALADVETIEPAIIEAAYDEVVWPVAVEAY
jgi:general secretion pathway protein A